MIWPVVVLPLVSCMVVLFLGRRMSERAVGAIASAGVGIAFLFALRVFFAVRALPMGEALSETLYTFLRVGRLDVSVGFLGDPLSATLLLMVSGVAFLIHVYSIGYMARDPGFARYFAYLNLFVFFMLLLVSSANLLLLFVGWEGVGFCSYLLIGFWYRRESASIAGAKAFIVNRVGDFAFALGLFLLVRTFGSLEIGSVLPRAEAVLSGHPEIAMALALLFFIGAMGKSAQLPLHIWLPNAMEGPTPVSALIHAATMVTAGVYLVCRMAPLFITAPPVMTFVAWIGVLTALYAALVALVQTDIKKVLAYSTISQLGYMFLAAGVGAFGAAIFHLVTHAFFKALLFLGAGAVIHALSDEMDIRRMGALRHRLPGVFWTFLIAALALAGLPGLSGFFSKDAILSGAFSTSPVLWFLAVATALLTAFYIFRLVCVVFLGESRTPEHPHPPPRVMTAPNAVLAALSVVGGYIGVPHVLGGGDRIVAFLSPTFGVSHAAPHEASAALEVGLMAVAAVAALVGMGVAYETYARRPETARSIDPEGSGLRRLLFNGFYVDRVLVGGFVGLMQGLAVVFWWVADVTLIDGAVNDIARLCAWIGGGLRRTVVGLARGYAFTFLLGAAAILVFLVWR